MKQLHAQFHEAASTVAQLAISGQKEAAEKAIGLASDFTRVSSQLMNALKQWNATL